MFEDSADDFGVIDQRDDLHRRAALGTFQGIGLVDLVDQSRPRRPGARRNHLSEQTGSTPNDPPPRRAPGRDRKSTRLNSSHLVISYAVFCLKKKTTTRLALSVRTPVTDFMQCFIIIISDPTVMTFIIPQTSSLLTSRTTGRTNNQPITCCLY